MSKIDNILIDQMNLYAEIEGLLADFSVKQVINYLYEKDPETVKIFIEQKGYIPVSLF